MCAGRKPPFLKSCRNTRQLAYRKLSRLVERLRQFTEPVAVNANLQVSRLATLPPMAGKLFMYGDVPLRVDYSAALIIQLLRSGREISCSLLDALRFALRFALRT